MSARPSARLAPRLAVLLADPGARRFGRFLIAGAVNTAFGYGLFALLVLAGLDRLAALVLAYGAGILWNYLGHARFVFGTGGVRRLPAYVGAYLAVLALNALALEGLARLGLPDLLAQALLVLPAACLSFVLVARALTGAFPPPFARRPGTPP